MMRLWSEVMVASDSEQFRDSTADKLQEEGAVVICVEDIDGALMAVEDGFRPDVLVLDGAMKSGPRLIAALREQPEFEKMPVVVAAPLRVPGALPERHVRVVRRNDAVVEAIQGLYLGLA